MLRDANHTSEVSLERLVGNTFLVGFDGTVLTPELRRLIEQEFVGAILLTSKNLKSAEQATSLISSLQWCAYSAQHSHPLLIALDQENGSINSLVDDAITQFPSAMGVAAIRRPDLSGRVAEATASELSCLGVNLIFGPVLDVLSTSRPSPLGVRAFSDDAVTVLTHGLETLRGFERAGVLSCGKHFPSYGDMQFADGTEGSLPSIIATAEDLRNRAFVPFRACVQAGLDAVLVGGCSMLLDGRAISHACLDASLVSDTLRREFRFEGCIISDCLAMETLCHDIGISQGVTRALRAGCDMLMLCQSSQAQSEALAFLKQALRDGRIPKGILKDANDRIAAMKSRHTSWERALNPPGLGGLTSSRLEHRVLSEHTYQGAVSIVRDVRKSLERLRSLPGDDSVLLLTPLVGLFPSIATRESPGGAARSLNTSLAHGEETFQSFGSALASYLEVKLVHTSYSANGLRRLHEDLIERSSVVIILTTDATRNSYQYAVTKHANIQCKYQHGADGLPKPLIVAALSNPQDFLADQSIETYICAYDFTKPSLDNLARILAGTMRSSTLPPLVAAQQSMQDPSESEAPLQKALWLVEPLDMERDGEGLRVLLRKTARMHLTLAIQDKSAFVVRNSSMKTLLGISILSARGSKEASTGQIGAILVDPDRKGMGIEEALRDHTTSVLDTL